MADRTFVNSRMDICHWQYWHLSSTWHKTAITHRHNFCYKNLIFDVKTQKRSQQESGVKERHQSVHILVFEHFVMNYSQSRHHYEPSWDDRLIICLIDFKCHSFCVVLDLVNVIDILIDGYTLQLISYEIIPLLYCPESAKGITLQTVVIVISQIIIVLYCV